MKLEERSVWGSGIQRRSMREDLNSVLAKSPGWGVTGGGDGTELWAMRLEITKGKLVP